MMTREGPSMMADALDAVFPSNELPKVELWKAREAHAVCRIECCGSKLAAATLRDRCLIPRPRLPVFRHPGSLKSNLTASDQSILLRTEV